MQYTSLVPAVKQRLDLYATFDISLRQTMSKTNHFTVFFEASPRSTPHTIICQNNSTTKNGHQFKRLRRSCRPQLRHPLPPRHAAHTPLVHQIEQTSRPQWSLSSLAEIFPETALVVLSSCSFPCTSIFSFLYRHDRLERNGWMPPLRLEIEKPKQKRPPKANVLNQAG